MKTLVRMACYIPLAVCSEERDVQGGAFISIAAIILAVLGVLAQESPKDTQDRSDRVYDLLCACAMLWLAVLSHGAVCVTSVVGAITAGLCACGILRRCAMTVAVGGVVLVLASWLSPLVLLSHDVAGTVGGLLANVIVASGIAAACSSDGVVVRGSTGEWVRVGTSLGHAEVRIALSFLVAGMAVIWIQGGGTSQWLRRLGLLTIVSAISLATVYGIKVAILAETAVAEPFVHPLWRSLLFGGTVGTLLLLAPGAPAPAPAVVHRSRMQWPVLIGVLACIVLSASLILWDKTERVHERGVAVDIGHSEWERADLPLTEEYYGARAVYNYSELLELLQSRYGTVHSIADELTDEVLTHCSVLMLKTPTRPYSIAEAQAIVRFVAQGGGVFMIGDHTDVFGMNTYLNTVAEVFGITFQAAAVFEHEGDSSVVTSGSALPPNELTRFMRPMRWMTACPLGVRAPAQPLVWANWAYADDPNYHLNTFFGNQRWEPSERLGCFAQLASAQYGRGRVLALADSTLFSSFSVCLPGIRELALGGVEWLHWREHRSDWLRVVGVLALVAVLWTLFLVPCSERQRVAILAFGAAVCIASVERGVASRVAAWPQESGEGLCVFDQSASNGRLPLWHGAHLEDDQCEAMFVMLQRTGRHMTVALSSKEALRGSEAVFVFPVSGAWGGACVERIIEYARTGGRALVFDNRLDSGSAMAELAKQCSVSAVRKKSRCIRVPGAVGPVPCFGDVVVFDGGESLCETTTCEPVCVRVRVGRGELVLCGLGEQFSNASVGEPFEMAGPRGFEASHLLFAILDRVDRADR